MKTGALAIDKYLYPSYYCSIFSRVDRLCRMIQAPQTMEEEIDKIFLSSTEAMDDEVKIERLRRCSKDFHQLHPYLELVLKEVEEMRKHFSVYDIQLQSLSDDLSTIQKKSRKIETQNEHETAIYNHLKELCIALTIDDEYFQILENGSFTNMEDLGKMEKSLGILGGIDFSRYKIRVVKEREDEMLQSQRNFLKRFVTFLSKLLIKSESSGELRVHRKLYKFIAQYKFIYAFGKRFDDYYSVLCSAYESHSKKMYDFEFETHLSSIYDLVDDADKLNLSLEVLTQSYESLIGCELNFIKMMDVEFSHSHIFKNINSMIIEFIGDMFNKSRLTTLISVGMILNAPESQVEPYEGFKEELRHRYESLEDLFFKHERDASINSNRILGLNSALKADCLDSLKNNLLDICIGKLTEGSQDIEGTIKRMQYLHAIESKEESVKEESVKNAIGRMDARLPKMIIDHVFLSGDEVDNTKSLIAMVDPSRPGSSDILKVIHDIVIQNSEDAKQLEELFSQNLDVSQ